MTEAEWLQRLLEIGKQMLSETDLNRILAVAVDETIRISGAERGLILLFGDEGEMLFQTARNLNEEIENPAFEISRTIIEQVRREGTTVYLDNAMKHQLLMNSKSTSRLGILSVVCLPLRHEGEIFGAVYLDNRSASDAFLPDTRRFLEQFADFISLAAHSALIGKKLQSRVSVLEEELRSKYQFETIIGHHPKMVQILKLISQIADTEATVLIQGESGTGKELVARALHTHSSRRANPFVPVNCGALPGNLIESELFGHTRGAFTGAVQDKQGWFARADQGTILLDEVSEMTPELQVKLLRILQTGEYSKVGSTRIEKCNVRIVAATNRQLQQQVREGNFREDLYYRLNVITIELPALRDRAGDVQLLARHFITFFCNQYGKEELEISTEAERTLLAYEFPGNVRELENIIQRSIVLSEGTTIETRHFPPEVAAAAIQTPREGGPMAFKEAKQLVVEKFEQRFIADCLKSSNGNISRAADRAGIHYKNFHEKMTRYGIDPRDYKKMPE